MSGWNVKLDHSKLVLHSTATVLHSFIVFLLQPSFFLFFFLTKNRAMKTYLFLNFLN